LASSSSLSCGLFRVDDGDLYDGGVTSREDWMRRLGPLYGGAVALVGSTPWRWPSAIEGNETRSSFWVVAVGAPIGIVAWVAAELLRAASIPPIIAGIVALAVLSFASATLIERGVVARIDGERAAGPSVTSILVLVFGTLVRAAAVLSIAPDRWFGVLVATALVGRWAAVFLQAVGDPIVDDVERRSLVATPAPAWMTAALSLGVAAVAVVALGKAGVAALALAAAIAFGLGLDAQRRERGLSPPVVATAAAIAELIVLVVAAIG
jgi:adenosylcobinamide-GDP ribazoletransferase